ncbi:MAG TPA: hypothetical protein ENN07_02530 [candidate division Zixibacteria bacterium]|nr:hypothetical protein [candidate division Zixibacteria bacterium]
MKIGISILLLTIAFAASAETLSVYDIQHTIDGPSPYSGQTVTVHGVISAKNYDGDKYFLADAEGGPWRGVFVYDFTNPVEVGQFVTMTARVVEHYEMTQLSNVSSLAVDSTGTAPPPWPTTCGEADTSEALEGVLVTIPDVVVAGGTADNWQIADGTGTLAVKRGFRYSWTPTVGDTIESIAGMMMFGWGEFYLEPRSNADISLAVPTETTFTPIADIQADPSAFGDVTVEGVITVSARALHPTQLKAYIQDESGMGIQLFGWSVSASMESLLVRGAVARVSGAVTEYQGTAQIMVSDWEVFGEDTLPTPLEYNDIEGDPVAWEGTWIALRGTVDDIYSTGASDWNVKVDVGGEIVMVRIWGTTGIDGEAIGIGDDIVVYGVGGVYAEEFQLLPAQPEDIEIVPFTVIPAGEKPEISMPAGVFVPFDDEALPITFTVPAGNRAVLRVFDRMGRNATTIYDGKPSARQTIDWNGRDETGQPLAEGVYMLLLESISASGARESARKTIAIGSALQ